MLESLIRLAQGMLPSVLFIHPLWTPFLPIAVVTRSVLQLMQGLCSEMRLLN